MFAEEKASAKSSATHFSFTRNGALIAHPEDMPKPGPYYTCLVNMEGVQNFPFEYALYFSTDHNHEGGIWLYLCNGVLSEAGSWKSYDQAVVDGDFDYLHNKPEKNPIFRDTVQGYSSETPHANVIDGTVYMTYHNVLGKGKGQATLLSTSPDGINFFRINGEEDSVVLHGSGHNGYFRWAPNPFSGVKHKYVGYSLYGGGKNYHSAMWVSDDAIEWNLEQVFTPTEGLAVDEEDRMLIWHEFDPASVRPLGNGEYIALCAGGNRASGSMERIVEIYEVFLADDGKTLIREARKVVPRGPEGSFDSEEATEPTPIVIGDTWYLLYVGTSQKGKLNTVMSATGTLDISAPQPPKLSAEDQQRHFYTPEKK